MNGVFRRLRTGVVILAAVAILATMAAFAPAARAQGEGLLGGKVQSPGPTAAETQAEIERVQKRVAAAPDNYRLHYELANLYYDSGQLEKAQASFEEAHRLNPKHVETLVNLGSVLSDLNKQEEAIEQFQKALSLNPDDCKARSNLGNTYYALSKYPDAMYEYRRAIGIDPKCYSALYNIGVAFADAGLFREAVTWWQKVVDVAPGTDAARSAEENIKILERFTQAPSPSQ
jgi:tetratricopeptide (TPR) repeat protein